MSFGFRANPQLDEATFERTRASLSELVHLRNKLVHHFIQRFDLRLREDCLAARDHFADCYSRIDGHYEELKSWARRLDDGRRLMVEFMQSAAFQDLLINGIAPDGSVDWSAAGCVRVLREAIAELAADGWTSLDAAIEWIRTRHPGQTPTKYGCSTWRQVLHDPGQFDIRRTVSGDRGATWYRERLAGIKPADI